MTAIFGKMFGEIWVSYLGLVVMMTAAFVMVAYGFLRETSPRRQPALPADTPSPTASVEKADTTSKLLPVGTMDHIPSVVDDTTELLKVRIQK